MDYRIVVLQRGWVLVGRYCQSGESRWLEGASVIRQWGTTKGLGELINGPLGNTSLDPCGRVDFHLLGEVLSIRVSAEKWGALCA